ncbi:hypothetical protein DEI89_13650 [Curtobacterium sp. MCBD17_030]|nr:hypothetical protein DEI89_13650 [Curtobacterium sp. MCBD17_030]
MAVFELLTLVVLPLLTMSLPDDVMLVVPRYADPVNGTVVAFEPIFIATAAVRGPAAFGANPTLKVHAAPAARVVRQVLLLTENDEALMPVTVGAPRGTVVVPVLCTVSTCSAFFARPMNVFLKEKLFAPRRTEPAASSPKRNSPMPGTSASKRVMVPLVGFEATSRISSAP